MLPERHLRQCQRRQVSVQLNSLLAAAVHPCAAQQLRFYFLRPPGGRGRGAPAPRRPHVGREHRCSRWPRRVNEKRDPQQPRSPNASSGAGARAGHFNAWRRELGGQRGERGHEAVLRPSLDRSACSSEPAAGRGSRENGGRITTTGSSRPGVFLRVVNPEPRQLGQIDSLLAHKRALLEVGIRLRERLNFTNLESVYASTRAGSGRLGAAERSLAPWG